jgi:hypothetical protein
MKNCLARRNPWIFATALVLLAILCAPLLLMAVTADATAGGNGASSLAMAGLMGAPLMLRDKADDHGGNGGGGSVPDVEATLAQIQDGTLPMSQRLSVAIQAIRGIDPTNQLAKIQTDLTDANAQIAARDTELTTIKADLDAANKRIAALSTDVTDAQAATAAAEARAKAAEAKEQDITKRVDARVKEELAAKGFPAAKLPNSSEHIAAEVPASRAELEDKLKACKTQGERSAMLRAFKANMN